MKYVSVRDALATILSKSASVEQVLPNVPVEEHNELFKALKIMARSIGDRKIEFNDVGQWQMKTVVHGSAHTKHPAGKQDEPEDKNPDSRVGVNIDKTEGDSEF